MTAAETWDEGGDGHLRWLEAQQQAAEEAEPAAEPRPDLTVVHDDYIATGGDAASAERKRLAAQAQLVRDVDHHRNVGIILAAKLAESDRLLEQARRWAVELENTVTRLEDELAAATSARSRRLDTAAVRAAVAAIVVWALFLVWVATR